MGKPAAKQGDQVLAVDTHIVMIPSPGGPIPTPLPNPFSGKIDGALATDVFVDGKAVALDGSTATNQPAHIPIGGPFQKSPADKGTVQATGGTVFVGGKAVARAGDPAETCNDPSDLAVGMVIAVSTTLIGD